ncbi:MAG: S41 family peptidase [Bryobacteraceae bacterium]
MRGVTLGLILFHTLLFGQSRDDRIRQDLITFTGLIIRNHPNPFDKVSRAGFESAVEQFSASLPNLESYEITPGFARLAALLRDGHTSVPATLGARFFPIRVRWFKEGLFVIQAPEAYGRALGKRIVRIQDKTAEEAYQALLPFISHEVDPWARYRSEDLLISPEVLAAAKILSEPGNAQYTFDDGGVEFSFTLSPVGLALINAPVLAQPRNPLWRRYPDRAYWFAYLEDSATLYFKYNQCRDSSALAMAEFTRQLLAALKDKPVRRWVIDMRNNGGGNSAVLEGFARELQTAGQRGDIPQPESAWVLIGRQSYSSAVTNAWTLRGQNVLLAGEPTGGALTYGDVLTTNLPNTNIPVTYSTKDFRSLGVVAPLQPDLAVELTAADFLADRDPVLEAVLAR